MNTFTATQIKTAFECPRLFWLGHHHGVKMLFQPPTTVPGIGIALHKLAEQMVDAMTTQQSIHDLFAAPSSQLDAAVISEKLRRLLYDAVFFPQLERFAAQQSEQATLLLQMWQGATQLIQRWTHLLLANRRDCPADHLFAHTFIDRELPVQYDFVLANDSTCRVSGQLDSLVYHFERQRLEVVDFKTYAPLDGTAAMVQTALYGYLLNRSKGVPVDSAVYSVLPQWQEQHYRWERLEETVHTLLPGRLQQMIDWLAWQPDSSGSSPPKTVQNRLCDFCLHAKRCREVFASAEPATDEVRDTKQAASDLPARPDPQTPALTGLVIGATESDRVIWPPTLPCTHIAVVGAAGSGKTWMAKVIAEEAVRNGIPVIAVDPQGDLVQFLHAAAPETIPALERTAYRDYLERRAVRIFTPGSSHAERQSLNPLRLPNSADLARIADPARRVEERHHLLSTVANNVVALAGIGGEVDAQRSTIYRILDLYHQQHDTDLDIASLATLLLDPTRIGLENPESLIKKSEREKLARKLNTFVVGPAANLLQGGQPLDISRLVMAESDHQTPLNIIYLNALADDDQKHFYVATLATEIYRWMIGRQEGDASHRPRLLFYLDEARDYIPAGSAKPPAKSPLIRLFTQGRKFGVGCLLATQSPRSVDYNVFGNCSTKLIGRLESSQDVERVKEWFTGKMGAPKWLDARKGTERGSFVGRWPEMPERFEGRTLRSRPLFSVHESAWSPERLEQAIRCIRSSP